MDKTPQIAEEQLVMTMDKAQETKLQSRGGSRTLPLGGHKLPKLALAKRAAKKFEAWPWVWLYLGCRFSRIWLKSLGKSIMDKRTTFFSP